MQYVSHSIAETNQIAQQLASTLHGGEVVLLSGDLGAGKTAFVKGLALALGIREQVTSPTFTLMNTYQGTSLTLHHFDFYRIGEGDTEALGFDEFFHAPDSVCCIEWNRDDCFWGKVIRLTATYGASDDERIYSWDD